MALPDYFKAEAGTPVIWGEAGGAGVTATLSLNGLTDAAGRMGAAVDLGAQWDQEYAVYLEVETGTAPAAGKTAELYMACSRDNSVWPGKVTGSDAAYPATASANKLQLEQVAVLISTNDGNTVLRQAPERWRPLSRYVAPVVINNLAQSIRTEGTPADNDSRVVLIPIRSLVQDAA